MINKFIILLFLCCSSVFGSELPNFPFLLVNGRAEIKVKPDRAKITFTVVEFSKDSKEAISNVSKRGQEIVLLALKHKISSDSVTSSTYQKSTKRAEGPKYQDLEILGYEVTQAFQVEITDMSEYQIYIDQVMSLSNITDLSAEFDISNRREIMGNLVKIATNDAKEKANELAVGLGVKVGSVFAVSQDSGFGSIEATLGVSREFGSRPTDFVPPPSLAFAPDGIATNVFAPKTIIINKSVSVIYKIK